MCRSSKVKSFSPGLYRTNKRGAFVRYLGEGHLVQNPANARDMWRKVFAWFDEFFAEGRLPNR